jgi:hypothetical protein
MWEDTSCALTFRTARTVTMTISMRKDRQTLIHVRLSPDVGPIPHQRYAATADSRPCEVDPVQGDRRQQLFLFPQQTLDTMF